MLIPALILVVVVGLFPVAVKVGVHLAQKHESRNGSKENAISTDLKIAG